MKKITKFLQSQFLLGKGHHCTKEGVSKSRSFPKIINISYKGLPIVSEIQHKGVHTIAS